MQLCLRRRHASPAISSRGTKEPVSGDEGGPQTIVKHAHASEVVISAGIQNGRHVICVRDNGGGFDVNRGREFGNGLVNMVKRMTDIEGTLVMDSVPGAGTTLKLSLPSRI